MIPRPRIGVVGELSRDADEHLLLPTRYSSAVQRAGGLPLALLPEDAGSAAEVLESLDGLLLCGADDFDTERLGLGPTHPAANPVPHHKQDYDAALVRAALERDLPLLGICYGMQLMGLVEGGTLHQHLSEDRPEGRDHRGGVTHGVRVEAGTKLEHLLGVASLDVISRHHQALEAVNGSWRVSAVDEEGLIEAIEHSGCGFALGVQWHPELSPAGGAEDRLFEGLVAAARAGARAPASGVSVT